MKPLKFTNPEDKTSHDLPPMTLRLQELSDSVQDKSGREMYQTQLDFLAEVLGAEYVAEFLGTDLDGEGVESVDLVALSLLFMRVIRTYTEPIEQEQAKQVTAQMKSVRPVLEAAKVAEQFGNSRQVFTRAK